MIFLLQGSYLPKVTQLFNSIHIWTQVAGSGVSSHFITLVCYCSMAKVFTVHVLRIQSHWWKSSLIVVPLSVYISPLLSHELLWHILFIVSILEFTLICLFSINLGHYSLGPLNWEMHTYPFNSAEYSLILSLKYLYSSLSFTDLPWILRSQMLTILWLLHFLFFYYIVSLYFHLF
jgi:hypothetical protein